MIMVNNIQQGKRLVRQSKSISGSCACIETMTWGIRPRGRGGGNRVILEFDHIPLRAIEHN